MLLLYYEPNNIFIIHPTFKKNKQPLFGNENKNIQNEPHKAEKTSLHRGTGRAERWCHRLYQKVGKQSGHSLSRFWCKIRTWHRQSVKPGIEKYAAWNMKHRNKDIACLLQGYSSGWSCVCPQGYIKSNQSVPIVQRDVESAQGLVHRLFYLHSTPLPMLAEP